MSDCESKVAVNSVIKQSGVISTLTVSKEDRFRIVISNASGSNTILIKGQIYGQLDFDTITTITGNTKQVINISTYDTLQLECTSFGSSTDYVRVIGSSFNEASVSPAIDGTAGNTIQDADTLTFTSSNNSVVITTDNATKTIDIAATGAGQLSKYTQTFNNTSDWTLNGSYYEFTVLAATHGNKPNPVVLTSETIAGEDVETFPTIIRNVSNDIILQVSQTPDNRYSGKIIIL